MILYSQNALWCMGRTSMDIRSGSLTLLSVFLPIEKYLFQRRLKNLRNTKSQFQGRRVVPFSKATIICLVRPPCQPAAAGSFPDGENVIFEYEYENTIANKKNMPVCSSLFFVKDTNAKFRSATHKKQSKLNYAKI